MAKTIKCNNCGAADLNKISDSEYRCNYCQARIVTEQPKFDFGSFFKTFNPNELHKRNQTTYHQDHTTVKNTSRLGCLMGIVILLGVVAGILVPIILAVRETVVAAENDTWKLSYTQQVYYAAGSKGPVVWVFEEENFNWKKNRSVLKIIDPVSKKTLHKAIVVPEHTSSETVTGIWDLYNGGRVFGDTIFFTPKGKGLEGRNIYTAKKIVDQAYFLKTTGSELAEAAAYNSSGEPYLRVKTDDGVEYCYFPGSNRMVTRDEFYKRGSDNKQFRYFFSLAGDHDKKYVLRINQLMNEGDTYSSFNRTYSEYLRDKNYYTRYYNVRSVDSIPVNHGFFNAEFIYTTDTSFVLKYRASLKEDAPWVIGSYGISGENYWKAIPSEMAVFKPEKTTDRVDIHTAKINGHVLMSVNSGFKAAACIDLRTGKTEWTFRRDK